MRHKVDHEAFLIFILQEHRTRLCEWDHPVTADESDLLSLVYNNLLSNGSRQELIALSSALEDQRKADNHEYHNNREAFERKREEGNRQQVAHIHSLFPRFSKQEEE
jgi:hypothetical protein